MVDTAIEMSVPGGSTPANQSPAALVARASRVTQNNGTPRENPIERALKIVDDRRIALAHDGFDAYLIVRQEAGGIRAIPVASIVFRQWLSKVHVAAGKLPPRGETVGIVRDLLEVEAREANETIRAAPGIRVARDDRDGSVLLDLGQPERTAIRITADGWSDPEPHPLDGPYTYRPPQFGALPTPQRDGDINELWKYVNIEDDGTRALVIAWAVQAILPSPVYPIMGVYGPQGSTKTTAQRILLSLCDPAAGNDMQLGKRPKDEGALMAQAKARRVLTFDNLSQIEPWFSDALCCLATGALIEARTLYSNFDLSTFAARRPIMLNGIPNVAEHGDLADRSLRVDC